MLSVVGITLVIIPGALCAYWLLPHSHGTSTKSRIHTAGVVFGVLALLGILGQMSAPEPFLTTLFFFVFTATALISAILVVTSANPIHSALWFASVVISTSGLFLLASAPFLAAGTVIVYAGAIIVTFLFVIMLAQMEGRAIYDRAARAPATATMTCFLLLWSVTYCVSSLKTQPATTGTIARPATATLVRARDIPATYYMQPLSTPLLVFDRSYPLTSWTRGSKGDEKPNVAGLGESLYTNHLVTVGLTGFLLFVALVGAVAIASPKPLGRSIRDASVPASGD
jgi:NADH-quinone oxidoreductase subunit J